MGAVDPDFDRKAAAFHRSWQRRNGIALAVAGMLLIVGALAFLAIVIVGIYEDPKHEMGAQFARGLGGLAFGLGLGIALVRMGYRVLRGKTDDPDGELRREIG